MHPDIYRAPYQKWWISPSGKRIWDLSRIEAVSGGKDTYVYFYSGEVFTIYATSTDEQNSFLQAFKNYHGVP